MTKIQVKTARATSAPAWDVSFVAPSGAVLGEPAPRGRPTACDLHAYAAYCDAHGITPAPRRQVRVLGVLL
jgi:hypothetical protein